MRELLNISTCNSSLRSNVGLTLETSVYQRLHGGNSTFINSFDKTKFSDLHVINDYLNSLNYQSHE